jgi:hypothetical protein
MVDVGGWYTIVDDNCSMQKLESPAYEQESVNFDEDEIPGAHYKWRAAYAEPMPPKDVRPVIEEAIAKCESEKTILAGVAAEGNFFYRPKKWSHTCYVRGKFLIKKRDGVPWRFDPRIVLLTDMAKTADVLARYGKVCVNRFCYADYKAWEPGGLGDETTRMPGLLSTINFLLETYPGLVCRWRDHPWFIHIGIKRMKQLQEWRKEHGYETSTEDGSES